MGKQNLLLRWITFIGGLFVMAFGVALSIKAGLGVSPISCIPYVYCQRFPLTMGESTIIFNILLIVMQMVVLGRSYKPFQLIQLPVVLIFGFFTDATLWMVQGLDVANYAGRFGLCLASCMVIGFAVFMEVKAGVTYLAGEGLALAISQRFKMEFGKAKIGVDCMMVAGGTISSALLLKHVIGVREGTVIAALLVGYIARSYSRRLHFLNTLNPAPAKEIQKPSAVPGEPRCIITISREFGSGGREIGRLVAQKLGIHFYDKEIVRLTAEESGFTPAYIQEHEQKLANTLLFSLYEQNYAYVNEQKPPLDALFLVQSQILRQISQQQDCVIVGRCASFVLKDCPGCFNVFIHANPAFKKERFIRTYDGDPQNAEAQLEQIDHDRSNYCRHFTGRERGKASNYDLTVDSSLLGIAGTAKLIIDAVEMAKRQKNVPSRQA